MNDDELRVVFLLFGKQGGMAQYSSQLGNAVAKYASVTVIAPESNEVRDLIDNQSSIITYETPSSKNSIARLFEKTMILCEIQRVVRDIEPNVVHVPFIGSIKSLLVLPLLWALPGTLVGTVHDPMSHSGQEVTIAGIDMLARFRALMATLLTVCFVHGPNCEEQAIAVGYPADKLVTVPHGLFTHFQSRDSGSKDNSSREYDILLFGNIRPNKGYDRVPGIIDHVARGRSDVSVLVAGSPSYGSVESERVVNEIIGDLKRHDHIEVRDRYIENAEVKQLFENATIALLPYYDATASGVLMTAYAFETPVVATDTGEIGRLIEEVGAGLVADAESSEDIAACVLELLEDDDLRAACRGRIADGRSKYEWKTIAEKTVSVYRQFC